MGQDLTDGSSCFHRCFSLGRGWAAGSMSLEEAALVTLALTMGVCTLGVEIVDRLAARSFPKSGRRRFDALTLWVVAGMLAAAAFL